MERCELAVEPRGLRGHKKDQSSLHWHLATWSGSLQQVCYRAIFDLCHALPSFLYSYFSFIISATPAKASRPPETISTPVCGVLNHTFLYSSVWKLRFHQAKSGARSVGPPSPHHMLHLTHCRFSLTTSSAATTTCAKLSAGWLGCATAALTHPRAPVSSRVNIWLIIPPCWCCPCLSVPAVLTVTLPSCMRPKCCWSTRGWSRGTHLPSSRATVKSLCCISPLTSRTAPWSWEPGPMMGTWSSSIL